VWPRRLGCRWCQSDDACEPVGGLEDGEVTAAVAPARSARAAGSDQCVSPTAPGERPDFVSRCGFRSFYGGSGEGRGCPVRAPVKHRRQRDHARARAEAEPLVRIVDRDKVAAPSWGPPRSVELARVRGGGWCVQLEAAPAPQHARQRLDCGVFRGARQRKITGFRLHQEHRLLAMESVIPLRNATGRLSGGGRCCGGGFCGPPVPGVLTVAGPPVAVRGHRHGNSDHPGVRGQDVVSGGRALDLQRGPAGTDPLLLHRRPERILRRRHRPGKETPTGVNAVKAIPPRGRIARCADNSGFREELVVLRSCHDWFISAECLMCRREATAAPSNAMHGTPRVAGGTAAVAGAGPGVPGQRTASARVPLPVREGPLSLRCRPYA
jgi:hypothetical protein